MTIKTISTVKTIQNIGGDTLAINNYLPPPPRKWSKGFLSVKSFFYLLSLILLFFLLSACPDSMTTYVNVPVYYTNTMTDTNTPTVTNHTFTIAENIAFGTVIGTINASDDIAVTSYLIIAGNDSYTFNISTNGELINIMNLDHDTISNYSLALQVSDAAGNTSNATITVAVTNVDASPTVTTMEATDPQNNSVTLNGNLTNLGINSDGSMQVNEYGFIYSTNASGAASLQLGKIGVEKIAGASIASTGIYSRVIANLSPGTIHYFRAFAINDGGTSYGGVSNFSTTYHQTFTLSGANDGIQSNTVYANSTHTYNVSLSHKLVYSLSIEGSSDITNSVAIYEGLSTEPLYIKAGPFTGASERSVIQTNTNGGVTNIFTNKQPTFPGLNNGSRYMVLPLAFNSHRIEISNNSGQGREYSLNLAEHIGTEPDTGRLLIGPERMGFYDSTNVPRFFWGHLPANKQLHVKLDAIRGDTNAAGVSVLNFDESEPGVIISTSQTEHTLIPTNHNLLYFVLSIRNSVPVSMSTTVNTNFRYVFRFVDP